MFIAKKKMSLLLVYGIIFIIFSQAPGSLGIASNFKMVKHLAVPGAETYPGSVISWGGTLDVDGNLKGSIILLGGQLQLDGVVEEDVTCVSAQVHLGERACINGALIIIGGKFDRHPQSLVKGEYYNLKFDLKKIESNLIPLLSDSLSLAFFKAIKIILWLVIALLVFAVLPRQINHAEEIFETNTMRIGLLGLLSFFLLAFLLFAFIVMSFFIIGIPLLFLLVLSYFLIYIFGRTVLFYFIGIKLAQLLKLKNLAPVLFIVLGVAIYSLLKFIPFFGPLILILMSLFEVGISVGFLFRKRLKLQA